MKNCLKLECVTKNTNGLRKAETFKKRVANRRKCIILRRGLLKKLIILIGIKESSSRKVTIRTMQMFFLFGELFLALDLKIAKPISVKLEMVNGMQGIPKSAIVSILCTV